MTKGITIRARKKALAVVTLFACTVSMSEFTYAQSRGRDNASEDVSNKAALISNTKTPEQTPVVELFEDFGKDDYAPFTLEGRGGAGEGALGLIELRRILVNLQGPPNVTSFRIRIRLGRSQQDKTETTPAPRGGARLAVPAVSFSVEGLVQDRVVCRVDYEFDPSHKSINLRCV
jgi:hypothetical protein